jgi:hypothetical protein
MSLETLQFDILYEEIVLNLNIYDYISLTQTNWYFMRLLYGDIKNRANYFIRTYDKQMDKYNYEYYLDKYNKIGDKLKTYEGIYDILLKTEIEQYSRKIEKIKMEKHRNALENMLEEYIDESIINEHIFYKGVSRMKTSISNMVFNASTPEIFTYKYTIHDDYRNVCVISSNDGDYNNPSELFINECEKRILTYFYNNFKNINLDEVSKFYKNNLQLEPSYISKPWLCTKLEDMPSTSFFNAVINKLYKYLFYSFFLFFYIIAHRIIIYH